MAESIPLCCGFDSSIVRAKFFNNTMGVETQQFTHLISQFIDLCNCEWSTYNDVLHMAENSTNHKSANCKIWHVIGSL